MNENKKEKKFNNEKKIKSERNKIQNVNNNLPFQNINFYFKNLQKPNSGNPNNVKNNNIQKNFKNKYYDNINNSNKKRDISTANPFLFGQINFNYSPNYNIPPKKRDNKSSPKNHINFFKNYIQNRNFDNNINTFINNSNYLEDNIFKNKKTFAMKIKDTLKNKNPNIAKKFNDMFSVGLNFNHINNIQFDNKSPKNISPKNLNLHLIDSPSPNFKKQNYLTKFIINDLNKPDNDIKMEINNNNNNININNINIKNNNYPANNNYKNIQSNNNIQNNNNNNIKINNNNNKNNNNNNNNNNNIKNNNNINNNKNNNNLKNNNNNNNNINNNNPKNNNNNNNKNNNNKQNLCYKNCAFRDFPNIEHRQYMEDFHIIIPNFQNDQNKSFFGIFDGHSGSDAAIYLKNNLAKIFQNQLNQTNNDINKSLIQSFSKIDNEIIAKYNESGSTCTVIFIYKDQNLNKKIFYCANVGDSKCYLITTKNIKQISIDHNCNDKNEVERIKKSGGIVFNGRVFGTLILTRSIGDKELKKYGVINEPSIYKKEIENEDKYLILASDGVWDVVNEDDIFNLSKNNFESEEFCKNIIQMSKDGDTRDNVSCIVIKLN